MTEAAARDAGIDYEVKSSTFEYVGAAIIADERKGLVKVLVDSSDRIIGAHVAGPEASELIYSFAIAMRTGATASEFASARAIHPTFAEALNWATW